VTAHPYYSSRTKRSDPDTHGSLRTARRRYSVEPADPRAFSERYDRIYSRIARAYDLGAPLLPFWRRWLRAALPHLLGPRVLEVSFGTGWLLTQYAGRFEAHGIDLNETMLRIATRNLRHKGLSAHLQIANVDAIPYPDDTFDTVLNTLAFSGYPDAKSAMSELRRVLKPQGRLVMIDANYPHDNNRLGTALMGIGRLSGDLIRDMNGLFQAFDVEATDQEIGGFGSIHLYRATKPT
jgi:ubiquinone/menaquinone biosynthesis C-methylase UbiE